MTWIDWLLTKDGDLSMALFSVIADAVQNERDNESRFFRDFGKALSLAGRRGLIKSIPCIGEPMERYPDAVHALWPFLWVDKEDWMVTIDYDEAMKYADPTVAESTLKQQVGRCFSKMLPHEVCLLEALRYCRENRKKGHDCGRINQCNHLRFLAIEVPTSDLGRKLAFRKGELV